MASIWLFPPCFNTLWIYTALKLISGKVAILHRFNTLWIYTALKLSFSLICSLPCFNTLWIYTALKRRASTSNGFLVSIPSEFTLLSNLFIDFGSHFRFQYPLNLHCSQTLYTSVRAFMLFQYPLNLHCSQTRIITSNDLWLFQYPLNLHCSQTTIDYLDISLSFNTLWIYTALKRSTSRNP